MNLPEELSTSQMKSYIVSVNGSSDKAFLKQFVESMPAIDAKILRSVYREITPNIDTLRLQHFPNSLISKIEYTKNYLNYLYLFFYLRKIYKNNK